MRSTAIYPGLSARCGLLVLLVAAAGCGAFRESPCVDAPMQTGCQVTMSVSPGRIVENQAVTLLLNFKEEGLGTLLGSLPNPPRVLLAQGNKKVEPGKPVVTAAGAMKVMLSEDLMRKLSPGEVQLSLSTDGGSVTAKLRIYAEPRLIAAYVEPNTPPQNPPRKWAGLRTSPGRIVLLEADKSNSTIGYYVEYPLTVNSAMPSMSMLASPNADHLTHSPVAERLPADRWPRL